MGYLVLDRGIGESLRIGKDIEIKILKAVDRNGKMKISVGIDAPREIPVHREEIHNERQRLGVVKNDTPSPAGKATGTDGG